jgi:hypothetical protein
MTEKRTRSIPVSFSSMDVVDIDQDENRLSVTDALEHEVCAVPNPWQKEFTDSVSLPE